MATSVSNDNQAVPNGMDIDDEEDEELLLSTLAARTKAKNKKEPLSLEELKAKVDAEEAAKAKPVFLTKEQRAEEALKRRQEEVAAKRKQQEEERKRRMNFMEEAKRSERDSMDLDRKSTRLNSSHVAISYAVFCMKKKNENA